MGMNYTEKNKLLDKISLIGLMAIFVEIFLYAVDSSFTGEFSDLLIKMPIILNCLGVIFLIVAVTLYILAYRKKKSSHVIYATEFLVVALLCPFLTYWYTRSTVPLKDVNPKILCWIVLTYYAIRLLYTVCKAYLDSAEHHKKKKKN